MDELGNGNTFNGVFQNCEHTYQSVKKELGEMCWTEDEWKVFLKIV